MAKRFKIIGIGCGLAITLATACFIALWIKSLPLAGVREAYRSGHHAAAIKLAEERLANGHPDDQEAMLFAARSYASLGRSEEAEAYFAQLPLKELEDFRLRARGLEARRLFDETAAVYSYMLQRWPLDGDALQHLTVIRFNQGRVDEATVLARRLIYIPSHRLSGYVLTGILRHHVQKHDQAVEAFHQALEISPSLEGMPIKSALILQMLAESLLSLGRWAEAERHAQAAIRLSTAPGPIWLVGKTRQRQGDEEGALRYWKQSLERDPNFGPALRDLGQYYLSHDEPDEALPWFQRAHEVLPQDRDVRQALTVTYRKLGREDEAAKLNESASVQATPKSAGIMGQ
jgi:tetratricopeptide (TPR) repeat protein